MFTVLYNYKQTNIFVNDDIKTTKCEVLDSFMLLQESWVISRFKMFRISYCIPLVLFQLTDLHVYIVPPDYWDDQHNCAFNTVMNFTTSVGFIRYTSRSQTTPPSSYLSQNLTLVYITQKTRFLNRKEIFSLHNNKMITFIFGNRTFQNCNELLFKTFSVSIWLSSVKKLVHNLCCSCSFSLIDVKPNNWCQDKIPDGKTTNFDIGCTAITIIALNYFLANIAGRLPENSRNSFVDLQSQKNSKKDRPKNSTFHWRLICYILIKNLHKLLLPLLADLK